MEVPEKLALMGGSILLASTFIFTLKSQASHIMPQVHDYLAANALEGTIVQMQHDGLSFDKGMQLAQQQHWQTGTWGTAPYYIDKYNDVYVSSGQLNGPLYNVLGGRTRDIQMIDFKAPVRAPNDSYRLLSSLAGLKDIRNLSNLDTSQAVEMQGMISSDPRLSYLDISNLKLKQAYDLSFLFYRDDNLSEINGLNNSNIVPTLDSNTSYMFSMDHNLSHLDLSHWRTSDDKYMQGMFAGMSNLQDLNISNFDDHIADTNDLFGYQGDSMSKIKDLTLGDNLKLGNNSNLVSASQWQNGSQALSASQIMDGNGHPGTWVKQ